MASGQKKRQAERDSQNAGVAEAAAAQVKPSALQTQRQGIYSDILTNGPQSKYAQPNVSQLALYKRNNQERDRAGAYGFGARYADPNLLAALGSQEEGKAAESDAINSEAMYENRFNQALSGSRDDDALMAQKYGSVIGQGRNEYREQSPWSTALTAGLTGLSFFSDERLKHNISDLDHGLDAVMALRPVEWDWNGSNAQEMGFIAQEVQQVVPELVVPMDEEGTLGVKYLGLLPVMMKALQEITKRLEALEEKR